MTLFVIGLVGSLVMLVVGVVYLILHFAMPGKEPSHMSYATYQSIIVRGNIPIIGSQPVQMQQQQQHPPLPPHGQKYPFTHQKPLPEHQVVNVAPSPASQHEQQQQTIQPTPLEASPTNETKEKIEVP
ncbi:hypothetical protein G6F46_007760 [Rhizopus delemar]|uniref:Uncharacterized protein n=2 Tax=Rhizopus TaxID=4842 RepID=A0A9P6YZ01_9FUNG|nr:hypothetical protein G6F43_002325 [Rhizopus delemar]KAG1545453.1 hypothetical protein G6F51_005455 [Rhizopus arrhizus]KAG1454815.1 hypothetical protein G6F55_007410 [Rhizopus delemar]KAG1495423.1 hypothetical protein G6F54_007182 [Rhizopus delemar]KAG1513280.1 hypothetical protein G6F53_004552 [Rhizopus delemar]